MYIYTGSASPPEMRGSQKGTDVAKNAKKKNGLRRKTGIRAFNRGREWKKKKTLQNEHARWNVFFFVAVSIKLCRKANSHTKEKRKLLKWGWGGGAGQGLCFQVEFRRRQKSNGNKRKLHSILHRLLAIFFLRFVRTFVFLSALTQRQSKQQLCQAIVRHQTPPTRSFCCAFFFLSYSHSRDKA